MIMLIGGPHDGELFEDRGHPTLALPIALKRPGSLVPISDPIFTKAFYRRETLRDKDGSMSIYISGDLNMMQAMARLVLFYRPKSGREE